MLIDVLLKFTLQTQLTYCGLHFKCGTTKI